MLGGSIVCVISCIVLCLIVGLFYYYYGAFRHPIWAASFMILSACIPIVMVTGILPYDISLSLFNSTTKDSTSDGLEVGLNILYWTSFVLTWVVVPVAVSYLSYSNSLSVKHRIWMVIRENLIFYGIVVGLVVLFLIIMITTKTLSFSSIPSLGIALGNGYGLLLYCAALGYAFVQLPKNIWIKADPARKYKAMVQELYNETQRCSHAVADADAALEHWRRCRENIEGEKASKYLDLGKPRADKLNLLKSALPIPDRFYTSECTNKKIVKVRNIDWKRCSDGNIEDFFALMDETANTLDECKNFVQTTADNAEDALEAYKSSLKSQSVANTKKYLKRVLDIFLVCLILLCYYGEVTLIFRSPQVNVFYLISRLKMPQIVGQLLVSFPIIAFIMFFGSYALVKARIGSFYRFIPHASNGNTLNYWAILIARLGPTIGYHYMLMIDAQETSFVKVMGVMDDVIFLGDYWNYFSPILMILISIFFGFNLWDKLKKICSCCGDDIFDDADLSNMNLRTGEEVLRELSQNVNVWIDEDPSLSVVNIGSGRSSGFSNPNKMQALEPLNI